jgi:hypothetical protein|tara:strand:+ start:297 stop:1163 length:867 start_codon:yes stop_codon:yes gene_type:complete
MKTVNSLSGGKTSSYIAANYPADYNVFSLVRTTDKNCMFPDKKIRQEVSDRIGKEFIGTLEMNTIIYTMLDLEQYIGKKIHWISGETFDDVIKRGDKVYLPNKTQRFCTIEMKIMPIFYWWAETLNKEVCKMRIGYRANEQRRAKSLLERCKDDGVQYQKGTFSKNKNGTNHWETIPYRVPEFPLIKDNIYKDTIEEFWKDKNVRFAYANNCVGCFHRNPVFLKHMSSKAEKQYDWFVQQELNAYDSNKARWKTGMTYNEIKNSLTQMQMFDDDFEAGDGCDSGYCGL